MKFVALALALLLAVGSHGASLQADAPSPIQQARSAILPLLGDVKNALKNSLGHLDGTEFASHKAQIEQGLDHIHQRVLELQTSAAPYTDAFFAQIMEATTSFREKIEQDIASLQPHQESAWRTFMGHLEGYRTQLEGIYNTHSPDMKSLQDKVMPDMLALRSKVESNWEETKDKLIPLVEAIRVKLNEYLETGREMAQPYVQEYKEQLTRSFEEVVKRASETDTEQAKAQFLSVIDQVRAKVAGQ